MTHKHHIIPKHLGGTNHPDNMIEVTVEEHAKIHHSQWILGGRWQDYIAWKGLTKQINKEEAKRLASSLANKGKPKSEQHRMNMRKPKRNRGPMSEEQKIKIGNAIRGNKRPDLAEYNHRTKWKHGKYANGQ